MSDGKLTPNVKKLAIHKASLDAIPKGGGIEDGIKFLSNPKGIASSFREAYSWTKSCIEAVRQAADPNPLRDADDETIAGEILRRVQERIQERKGRK